MRDSVLMIDPVHPQAKLVVTFRERRSDLPGRPPVNPWLNRCSYFQVSFDSDSGRIRPSQHMGLLGQPKED